MSYVKSLFVSFIVPVAAVCLVAFAADKTASTMYFCKQQYALCTSALCIPNPGDPSKAICFCDVEEGPSMATVPCDTLKPSMDSHGIKTLYSTFSLEQFKEKKGMKCPEGTPWTWCLNKQCTVDPSNPSRAICLCDVMRTQTWMTLGGNCDTKTCEIGYWSGAALSDFNEGNLFLIEKLGLEKSPLKWCEITP